MIAALQMETGQKSSQVSSGQLVSGEPSAMYMYLNGFKVAYTCGNYVTMIALFARSMLHIVESGDLILA